MYQARILDKDRQLKAVLPGVRWHYTRRINEATDVSVYIPRETIDEVITQNHPLYGFFAPTQPVVVEPAPRRVREDKTKYAEIASYVQIYKGDKLKASGKIVGRTLDQVVTVHAMTEEILLETSLTPAQYGKVWDGWDLADVARDLLDGWQTIRVKDISQWQDRMVDSSNVDLTTEPGTVMLAKQANGRYYSSGYITLVFSQSEIANFKSWDRVRWSADSEDPVKTSIQVSYDGSNWSQEFDGGLPEEIGYYIGGDHDQVWVRINLSTTDTESEDANGVPTGVTPTVFAVELIARTEGKLVAGNIPSTAGVTVKGLSADYSKALQVLVQACEQAGWEFSVWNGTLNIAEALGVDRTKDFVFRAGSNIKIQTLGDGDGDLVNILTAYGPGRGINRMEITLRDEASIAEFGEYPLAMEFDAETLDELEQKAQEFLSEHNSPKTQFEITVDFKYGKEPEYGLGDKVRVADPETGIVTTTRIMAESREYGESGLVVNLELGKAGFKLAEAISGEKRVAKPLDPLQPSGVYARGIIKGIVVGCSAPKTDWAYTECHVSTAKGFVPGSATLVDKGKQTRFDIPNLDPGVRYYARLIHVDSSGRRSEPSREVSAVAQYIPVEALPDYSIGIEKFMENIKPPVMVSSLPELPDPRYTIGTTVFLIADNKLYSTDGNTWVPVGAGTVTADEIVAGIITAGGIKADWYAEIRNVLPYVGTDSLDEDNPIEVDFYIPTETDSIVSIKLSAKALRYRAYARTTSAGGSHAHEVVIPSHAHNITLITDNGLAYTRDAGEHTHGHGSTGATTSIFDIETTSNGSHSHDVGGSTDTNSHGHSISIGYVGDPPHSHPAEALVNRHSHSVYGSTDTVGSHSGHIDNIVRGVHSHSIDDAGLHGHLVDYSMVIPFSATESGGGTISTSEYADEHTHSLAYGIMLDTTPANVMLYCHDGTSYDTGIALSSAPTNPTQEYVLATELDLTSAFSGTGWKRIKFTSSRRGRITWQLIVKLDITA